MTTAFLYDTHAHLTCETLLPQADRLVEEALQAGVLRILVIATDSTSLKEGCKLQQRWPDVVRVAAARTPHDIFEGDEAFYQEVLDAALTGQLVAIGETGLDLYNAETPLSMQQMWMRRYLKLAQETKLPVVLHCRNAFKELFAILDEVYQEEDGGYGKGGVLHCFTGNTAEAHEVIKRGFYLSLSGILTYKKSEELRLTAKELPLSQLLIETDSPYLAPQSHRGKVNCPAYVAETALYLAQVHGIPNSEVQRITSANALKLFGDR